MEKIVDCPPYDARVIGTDLLRKPDGKSVFKIYYVSRLGRDNPALYEWEHCALTREEFEAAFLSSGQEGMGFVIAFPHVTKVFRFSAAKETILDVREFITRDLQIRNIQQDDGFHEFSCFAEAVIAAEEYKVWARALSVEEYLENWCESRQFPVRSNNKLKTYLES